MCGSPKASLFYRQLQEQTRFPFVSCVFVCDIEGFTIACGLFLTGSSNKKNPKKIPQRRRGSVTMLGLCTALW